MKFHITNLYNFNFEDELVTKQHRFADAGRELGFTEMGIFSYPVETDTPSELSKRLDGIISALEFNETVFVQLPTKNGYTYEELLIRKLQSYKAKIILLLHDFSSPDSNLKTKWDERYFSLFQRANIIITAPSTYHFFKKKGFGNLLSYNPMAVAESSLSDFYSKKILMDALERFYSNSTEYNESEFQPLDDEIQIAFGLHDETGNYSVWVGTAMQSIIDYTTSKLCFHILHDNYLSDSNKAMLSQVVSNAGHRISFHLIDTSIFHDVVSQVGNFTIGTMFRIMLPEFLPNCHKIIYLDADILVCRDIKDLWNIDISNFYLAAVPDMGVAQHEGTPYPVRKNIVPADKYFNAGVLLFNLQKIQKYGDMKTDILNYLSQNKESNLPDQDALNVLYGQKTLLLENSWNYFAKYASASSHQELQPMIYHYAGHIIQLQSLSKVDLEYYETIIRTPWGIAEGRKHISKSLTRMADRVNQLTFLLKQVSVSTKKFIFYGKESYAMKTLYELLTLKECDYRILANPSYNESSILPCKNRTILNQEKKGNYIVFVLPEADNGTAIEYLVQLGLKNEQDFFVIPRLLPPEKGGYV